MIKGLSHVAIRIRDIEASARWYTEVLGLCEAFRMHREDGSTWLIVSHQWDAMNDLFDEVHHLEKGRIVE